MTHVSDALPRAFYAGKDAIPGDRNPYALGSREHGAWDNGFASEYGERIAMSDAEVADAFEALGSP
jgi:hypothetical protein